MVAFVAWTGMLSPANAQSMMGDHLGVVHFPISCPAAQSEFDHAIALLHSFFYPETVKAFQKIIAEYPDCAMAYWGLAMSQRPNPMVPPFPTANLKAGAEAIERAKLARLQTPREAAFIAAVEVFFRDYDRINQPTRTKLYEVAMRRLHERYPNDTEAAIFYALALNEAVDLKDKTFSKQLEAAAILHAEQAKQPDHPGIAHYVIHSYDFAPIEEQGVPSARLYDKVAPASPHALHMPSHTYSMLGMWPASIRSNKAAEAAAIDYAAKNFPDATDPSLPHFLDFLVYGYLQLAKDNDARLIVNRIPRLKKFASVRLTVDTALAAIPARFALERGQWDEAARLDVRASQFPAAQSITYFARALGDVRSHRLSAAKLEVQRLRQIEGQLEDAKDEYWAGQTRIQVVAAEAWILIDESDPRRAVAQMRLAATLDDASEKNVAMENKLLPMRELLGELYLEAGQNEEALAAFTASLKVSRNRCRSITGAMAAARRVGLKSVERRYHQDLVRLIGAQKAQSWSRALSRHQGTTPCAVAWRQRMNLMDEIPAFPYDSQISLSGFNLTLCQGLAREAHGFGKGPQHQKSLCAGC